MSGLPQSVVELTRPLRRLIATSIFSAPAPKFDHGKAQRYELAHAEITIRENHQRLINEWERAKRTGDPWQSAASFWFNGDEALWQNYKGHIDTRKALEIGAGPFGEIPSCYWMKDRTVIDPLVDQYRLLQLGINGKTFLTEDIETIAAPAEQLVEHLVGRVTGAIFCRNALDHCEDPLSVLANISAYAACGCYFFLWTDIWHLDGPDEGHRNITKNPAIIDAIIGALGFEILRHLEAVRSPGECIEYGCVAHKIK